MIDTELERRLKGHFDDMAASAPLVPALQIRSARRAGDRRRRHLAMTGGGVLTAAAVAATAFTHMPSDSGEPPAAASNSAAAGTTSPTAGTGAGAWAHFPAAAGAAWEVERYASLAQLFGAAPLVVQGTVVHAEVIPGPEGEEVDGQRTSDLLLTIDVEATAGSGDAGPAQVVVQLGPLFADEAEDWVAAASSGPEAIIGTDTVWALRARTDARTYRPLTSDALFVRSGVSVVAPLAGDTLIEREATGISWRQLLDSAGGLDDR